MDTVFVPSLISQHLPMYYKNFFPFKSFCKWLYYGQPPGSYFALREFAFILEGDVHLRFQSFGDSLEFERELCKVNPEKLDIGAVYSHMPKDNKKFVDFHAVERELIFDIDLTDYDDVRTCCSEAKVCPKCWRWITIAVKVLDKLLKEHFGFQHRLWVFSGRRGVHCWVADEVARKLTNIGRAAVAEYLSLVDKKRSIRSREVYVHPMIDEAYSIIMESGEIDKMVIEQQWFDDFDSWRLLVEHGCDPAVISEVKTIFTDIGERCTGKQRWNAVRIKMDPVKRKELKENGIDLCDIAATDVVNVFRNFILQRTYPRLDVNVSTGVNHLLKSPFCIHPKTGRVAVPFSPGHVSRIEVDSLPRIDQLMNELSKVNVTEEKKENRRFLAYKHTSLAPFIETFEAFVNDLTNSNCSGDL
ncbi:hypothetical protein AB6A40_006665 [Gnathostoma spinigerum]|uniref:DNA primase n=1 Tax=Gnathostoma spinigerum TaxID=75299 RepID=A0ABD6EJM4_9BILA